MDAPRCMRLQIWEGTKHPILITNIWLSSCWLIQTIQKIQNSARHIEMQWFGMIHQPTLLLSQSEASSEPLDSIIKKEATVYNPSPLCRLFLPQWVAGCLQRKKTATFIDLLCGPQIFPNLLWWQAFLSPVVHIHLRSQRGETFISRQRVPGKRQEVRWWGEVRMRTREDIFFKKGDSHQGLKRSMMRRD